jgi:hypothetical protein
VSSCVVIFIFRLYLDGDFSVEQSYLYITLIYNISFTVALYFLVMFYESIKKILVRITHSLLTLTGKTQTIIKILVHQSRF